MTEFCMTCSIAAAGKSTWANQQEGYLVLDSDLIRKELWGSETDQQNPDKVFNLMYKRSCEALERGQSVVYCATNLNMRFRVHTLNQIKHKFPDVYCRCVIFNTPLNICKEWNKKRERQVPDWLFERQLKAFQVPVYNEGWDKIEIFTPIHYDKVAVSNRIWRDVKAAGSQDNPHHTLSLYEHQLKCIDKVDLAHISDIDGMNLLAAAGIHDIGKAYTRVYDDEDIAHYYGHESYGAYLAMNMGVPLEVVQLVGHHMHPYNPQSSPAWKKRLGDSLWNKILILHHADQEAH